MDCFDQGRPLYDFTLHNRLEICFQHFLTEDMNLWCSDLTQLRRTLDMTGHQMAQFMEYIHARSPALEERFFFMDRTQNNPAPDHEKVNPADRHFQPKAQFALREAYSENPDRTLSDLTILVATNKAIGNDETHAGKEERIVKQVAIWWDCQHDLEYAEVERLNPAYLNDEHHLLFDLIRYSTENRTKLRSLCALSDNMWRYRYEEMLKDMNTMKDIWNEPGKLYNYINTTLQKPFLERVQLRQDKLGESMVKTCYAVDKLLKEEKRFRIRLNQRRDSPVDEMEMVAMQKNFADLNWINYNLYIQATLERDLLGVLVHKFGTEHNQRELNISRHLKLIYECDRYWCRLEELDRVHRRQREVLHVKISEMTKAKYCPFNGCLPLPPPVPDFPKLEPVGPPTFAVDVQHQTPSMISLFDGKDGKEAFKSTRMF